MGQTITNEGHQTGGITAPTKLYIHCSPVHRLDGMDMVYGARLQHNVISSRFTSVKNKDQQQPSSTLENRNARRETITTSSWIRENMLATCVQRRKDIEGPKQSNDGNPYGLGGEILARTSTDTKLDQPTKEQRKTPHRLPNPNP